MWGCVGVGVSVGVCMWVWVCVYVCVCVGVLVLVHGCVCGRRCAHVHTELCLVYLQYEQAILALCKETGTRHEKELGCSSMTIQ